MRHAERLLEHLGIGHEFTGIIDIVACAFEPKLRPTGLDDPPVGRNRENDRDTRCRWEPGYGTFSVSILTRQRLG